MRTCKILCLILSISLSQGCTRLLQSPAHTQNQTSAEAVTGKRNCTPSGPRVSSGDGPTRVFHWTTSEKALHDPKAYIAGIVADGIAANDTGRAGDWMGNGLYLAADPLQSASYGHILVEFDVRPGTVLPYSFGEGMDAYEQGCPGTAYTWRNRYTLKASLFPSAGLLDEVALALFDLGPVDLDSVKAFSMAPDRAPTGSPARDRALSRLFSHRNKYYDHWYSLPEALQGGRLDNESDFKGIALLERLEKHCFSAPYGEAQMSDMNRLVEAVDSAVLGFADSESFELTPDVVDVTSRCLKTMNALPSGEWTGRSLVEALEKLLPTEPEFREWLGTELDFWRKVRESEGSANSMTDWRFSE